MFTPEQKKIAQLAVFNGLQFQDRWIVKAAQKMSRLGLFAGKYVAAHMRRGDSVDGSHGHYSDWNLEDNYGLLKEKARYLPVLVATDAKDSRTMMQNLSTRIGASRVVLADDDPQAQGSLMEGMITDILMCTMAGTFIGTPASTFSSLIFTQRVQIQKCREKKQGLPSKPSGSREVTETAWFTSDLNRFHMLGKEDKPGWPSINHAPEGDKCNLNLLDTHRPRLVSIDTTNSNIVCKLDAFIP